jgi:hypothetical protein
MIDKSLGIPFPITGLLRPEVKILRRVPIAGRSRAAKQLIKALSTAEAVFARKQEKGNWQRQNVLAGPPGPPPQDWAALEYAQTRLAGLVQMVTDAALNPAIVLPVIDAEIKALADVCIHKLQLYEDIVSFGLDHRVTQGFRGSLNGWLCDGMRKHNAEQQIEARLWEAFTRSILPPAPKAGVATERGDPSNLERLIQEKGNVDISTAALYLSLTRDHVARLVRQEKLARIGQGRPIKVSTGSLRTYKGTKSVT